MERYLNQDNFEQLLKEKADDFKMYPNRKVWSSLYNNLHPGSKMPSLAMTVSLISILFIVGLWNANVTSSKRSTKSNYGIAQQQTNQRQLIAVNYLANTNNSGIILPDAYYPFQKNIITNQPSENLIEKANDNIQVVNKTTALAETDLFTTSAHQPKQNSTPIATKALAQTKAMANVSSELKLMPTENIEIAGNENININNNLVSNNDAEDYFESNSLPNNTVSNTKSSDISFLNTAASISANINNTINQQLTQHTTAQQASAKALVSKNAMSETDKAWIEHFAFHNKRVAKKWANKLSWTAYITPSATFRELKSNVIVNNIPSVLSTQSSNSLNTDINNSVSHIPAFGIETGAAFKYEIFKGIRVTAGLQLNYTRYTAMAFENSHPVATTLTMNNFKNNSHYEVYKTTPFSNGNGLENIRLHNQTFQIAMPIGAEFRLAGKQKLQWYVGTNVQPTFVIAGKSYLISSDRRNYVEETSMLNHWNINANLETFITYKANNNLTWQIGPQYRRQLFTTNKKVYAVEERLTGYGIKLGVSKLIQ
ncbi:MAG: hypothetical protein ACOYKE_06930 [Ferruginibacter sp.]